MSEPTITPEILEVILRTSRVKGCKEVYSLAPRGHRVGIYFQQRRATLLAAALRSRLGEDRLRDCRIGIVGAGVSGMMFLLAIRNQGATDICVYETADQLITRGTKANHRLLHPNYNRWPLLGSMDVFTSLPMLNWYATSANKVAEMMKNELDSRHDGLVENHVRFSHTVKRITQRSAEFAKPLRVKFLAFGAEAHQDHNIVIIAAGFGSEGATTWGLNDYWNEGSDDFDEGAHKRQCTVYGSGDGALIDVIRACAGDPAKAWRLPLEMIAGIRTDAARTFQKNDRSKKIELRQPAFTAIERNIQAHEESIRCMVWSSVRNNKAACDAYAVEEMNFYLGCIEELRRTKRDTLDKIDALLKRPAMANLCPVLVGTGEKVFEPTSAPINKLLLAYLMKSDRVVYIRRTKSESRKKLKAWRNLPATERGDAIVVCRFGAPKNFPLANDGKALAATGIVVDVEGLGAVYETKAEAHLIDALSGITGGEYIYFDSMPDPLIHARNSGNREEMTFDTLRENTRILQEFANEHLDKAAVVLVKQVGMETYKQAGIETYKWVLMTALSENEMKNRLVRLGGIDGNFLGAPIVYSEKSDAMTGPF